jgi:hypothetical protein
MYKLGLMILFQIQTLGLMAMIFKKRLETEMVGDGVCIYIRSCFKYTCISNPKNIVESSWIEDIFVVEKLCIGCMYRPPDSDSAYYESMIDEVMDIKNTHDKFVLMGDLNFNYIVDENLAKCPIHYIESIFDLKQLVEKPTRETTTSSTLIDIILTSIPAQHISTKVIKFAVSDHYCVQTSLKYNVSKHSEKNMQEHKTLTFRDYKNFVPASFLNDIQKYDFLTDISFDDKMILEKWSEFKIIFIEESQRHAPEKTRRLKERQNPWIDHEIIKLMYKRDFTKQTAVRDKCNTMWNEYKRLKNEVSFKIKQAKKDYNTRKANEGSDDPKKRWKFLNKAVKTKDHTHPPSEISANDFNTYFSSI